MTLFAFYNKHSLCGDMRALPPIGLYVAAKNIGQAERIFRDKYPYSSYGRVEKLGSVTVQPDLDNQEKT